MKPVWIIGFSGHRHIEQPVIVERALHQVLDTLNEQAKQQGAQLEYYGSAAYGADLLAAQEAQGLKMPVHIVLPLSLAEFIQDFHVDDGKGRQVLLQREWDRALALITEAGQDTNEGTLRYVRNGLPRPDCYYEAGAAIVDTCDILLVVWDGLAGQGLGGTADMVAIARATGKPVVMIDPVSGVAMAQMVRNGSYANATLCDVRFTDEPDILDISGPELLAASNIDEVFSRLDARANESAFQYRTALKRVILMHGTAALVAGLVILVPGDRWWHFLLLALLSLVELVLVGRAFFQSRSLHRMKVHEHWIYARLGAELMRGLKYSIPFTDPLHSEIARRHSKWGRLMVSAGLMALRARPAGQPWTVAADEYWTDRVSEQITHFNTKGSIAVADDKRAKNIAHITTFAALAVVLFAFLYKAFHVFSSLGSQEHQAWSWRTLLLDLFLFFLPIALPLIAGLANSLRIASDDWRRQKRYRKLHQYLVTAKSQFATRPTFSSASQVIIEVERELTAELMEWEVAEGESSVH